MKNQQVGVVLLTTIFMIAMLTLFILSSLQSLFMYVRLSNQAEISHQDFYRLETVANQISLSRAPEHCRVNDKSPNQQAYLLTHKHGCALVYEHQDYHYLQDDLGVYPCLHIVSNDTVYSSHHWLISVNATKSPRMVLQLRVSIPVELVACEWPDNRQISAGIVSWRYFNAA